MAVSIIDQYKEQIKRLYENNTKIHMDVTLSYPRLTLTNEEAIITAVYRNLFQIEENKNGETNRHTISYTDLITKQVVIKEIEMSKE